MSHFRFDILFVGRILDVSYLKHTFTLVRERERGIKKKEKKIGRIVRISPTDWSCKNISLIYFVFGRVWEKLRTGNIYFF